MKVCSVEEYRAPTALLGCSDTGGNKDFRTVLKEDKIC